MNRINACLPVIAFVLPLGVGGTHGFAGENSLAKALSYLEREVPRWRGENGCFSCHNNGDAARALLESRRRGKLVPEVALSDTVDWLQRPEDWDHNGGEGTFSDKRLARIQFAVALATAIEAGLATDRDALRRAVQAMAADQNPEGFWPVEPEGQLGSPTTYGNGLATWLARGALVVADRDAFRDEIARADRWLANLEVRTMLDAAVIVLAKDVVTEDALRTALELIHRGQGDDGGWGPFATASAETFDTALVVIALCRSGRDDVESRAMIRRGVDFLAGRQDVDGSWVETTRPSGFESYAQRLSTTGWATLALLEAMGSTR